MAVRTSRSVLQKMHVAAYAERLHLLSELFDIHARKYKGIWRQGSAFGAEKAAKMHAAS